MSKRLETAALTHTDIVPTYDSIYQSFLEIATPLGSP